MCLTGTPYVTLWQSTNGRIQGEYRIGVQYGTLTGYAYEDFIDFTLRSNDEMKDAFGEGETTLDRDCLTFQLRLFQGNEYTLDRERQRQGRATPSRRAVSRVVLAPTPCT